jgi:hypothetical protein
MLLVAVTLSYPAFVIHDEPILIAVSVIVPVIPFEPAVAFVRTITGVAPRSTVCRPEVPSSW